MVVRERGAVSAEVAVLMPLVLLMALVVIHFGLWYHAAEVAHAVAAEGVRAGRVEGGTESAATNRARAALAELGPAAIREPVIDATVTAEEVRVQIRGRAPRLIPLLDLPVRGTAVSPRERFRSP